MNSGEEQDALAEQQFAVTRDRAARIAGLSHRQVDYWASTGLVQPTVDTRLTPGRRVRLYGFVDLLALIVAAELKTRNVSLQHIRVIVGHLKARGYTHPLTQLVFATHSGNVYFQHDDGTWEGDIESDQLIMHEVVDLNLLHHRITAAARRDERLAGKVERRRGAMGSKPVLAGTRVPVDTVRRYLDSGRTVKQVLEAFPVLTAADIEAVQHGAA